MAKPAINVKGRKPLSVVRFRLLRDMLRKKPNSDMLGRAHAEMLKSRWVLELANEQRADESWGRFSSMKYEDKTVTTEASAHACS